MSGPINLTGITSDYAVPITAVEIRFGMGPGIGGSNQYTGLLIGNKTSAGSATADTVIYSQTSNPPLQTERDAITLFGAGSEAHRLYRRWAAVNQSTPVSVIVPAEGGSATAASLTLTLATTATGPGTLRVFVGDEFVDTAISTGDLPAAIATAAAQKINNQTNWAVTSSPSSATIVITSKNAGLRANEIRVRALILSSPGMTVSGAATSTALSGGTVTDDWTTALATIASSHFYYIVSPANDVTQHTFDDLMTQVLSQALPANGNRQIVIAGHVGTQSAASTVAANSAINTPRARIVWQEQSEWTAGELAAQYAAAKALFDTTRTPKYNFDNFGATSATQQFWKVPPQSQENKRPTRGVAGSINTAVNNGLTCIATTPDGMGTYVVMDVTTKHKDGSNYDYRNRDGHITTVCDFFADQAEQILTEMRSGKNLVADPPAGTIIQDRDTVYPKLIGARIGALVQSHSDTDGDGWFKNVPTILSTMHFQIATANQSRSEGYIELQVVNLHHQAMLLIDEASTRAA